MIFDPLYRYDYLARPYKIVPNTATAMPEISPDGKTWIMHVRPGIFFSEDPAFNGKKRELVAADYVYAWKRIIDPRARSNNVSVFDGKLVGADKVVAGAKASGKFDYDAPIEGLQAIDRYTIQVKLNFPTYELQSDLTTSPTAAVAREVVEKYGDDSGWAMANPVGTGPYRLKEWRRTQKIVLDLGPGRLHKTPVQMQLILFLARLWMRPQTTRHHDDRSRSEHLLDRTWIRPGDGDLAPEGPEAGRLGHETLVTTWGGDCGGAI